MEYNTKEHANLAISTFNNRAVDNLVCTVRPVVEKGETAPRLENSELARRVQLMNVPYDALPTEIENLCKEFVKLDRVVIPRDNNGLARGYAFVFLKKAMDVQKLIDFVDGRHLRSR